MDFDRELSKVGEWGHYQRLVLYCLLVPATLPCAFHAYNQLFMASVPDHWCKGPSHLLGDIAPHLSSETVKQLSIPYDNITGRYSRCQKYEYNYTRHLETLGQLDQPKNDSLSPPALAPPPRSPTNTCGEEGWTYDLPEHTTSVVAQWDLVCERSFDPTLALVLLGAAGLVGNYIFGYLQDGLGRRPSFFIYLSILCVFGIATAYAPSFNWWLACRIGVGFTVPAVMATPFVLSIELVGPEQRTFTTVIMNVGYSSGLILLSGVAYLTRDWSQLALATTIPFLAFFIAFKAMPESPRWLTSRGRISEAQQVLLTIARVNRRNVRPNFLQEAHDKATLLQKSCLNPSESPSNSEDRSYGVLDLFRTPNLARKTLIITFIWFTNTSVYVGLSYYAPSLGGDAYLNFFLAGVSELPTYLFLWPSMEYWGRRWTLCAAMIIGGTACIATVCSQDDPTTTLVLYCIGKFGISSSFVVLPLTASELYPTVVRGVGLSLSAVAGMIGPIVVPLINHLGSEMMVLPLMIMGALLVVGGLFSLLLPETLHHALPNTLLEGELFGKSLTISDYCNCCPRRRTAKMKKLVTKKQGLYTPVDPGSNMDTVEPVLLPRTTSNTDDYLSSLLEQLPSKCDKENGNEGLSEKTRNRGNQSKDVDDQENKNLIGKPNVISIV